MYARRLRGAMPGSSHSPHSLSLPWVEETGAGGEMFGGCERCEAQVSPNPPPLSSSPRPPHPFLPTSPDSSPIFPAARLPPTPHTFPPRPLYLSHECTHASSQLATVARFGPKPLRHHRHPPARVCHLPPLAPSQKRSSHPPPLTSQRASLAVRHRPYSAHDHPPSPPLLPQPPQHMFSHPPTARGSGGGGDGSAAAEEPPGAGGEGEGSKPRVRRGRPPPHPTLPPPNRTLQKPAQRRTPRHPQDKRDHPPFRAGDGEEGFHPPPRLPHPPRPPRPPSHLD